MGIPNPIMVLLGLLGHGHPQPVNGDPLPQVPYHYKGILYDRCNGQLSTTHERTACRSPSFASALCRSRAPVTRPCLFVFPRHLGLHCMLQARRQAPWQIME
eukprot:jgi/Botrbrau1/17670/Bobra.0166s0096.1